MRYPESTQISSSIIECIRSILFYHAHSANSLFYVVQSVFSLLFQPFFIQLLNFPQFRLPGQQESRIGYSFLRSLEYYTLLLSLLLFVHVVYICCVVVVWSDFAAHFLSCFPFCNLYYVGLVCEQKRAMVTSKDSELANSIWTRKK